MNTKTTKSETHALVMDLLCTVDASNNPPLKRKCLEDVEKLAGEYRREALQTCDPDSKVRLANDAVGLDSLVDGLKKRGWNR